MVAGQHEHTAAELRGLAAKSTNAAQARRMLALAMVMEGMMRAEAARLAGMDRQTLRDWVHRYNGAGIEGLVSRVTAWRRAQTDRRACTNCVS